MGEPEFIAQCGEPMTPEQSREWCRMRAVEAEQGGATFHRWTIHEDIPHLILYEGWKVRPDDQGEPRFQFASTAS